MMDTELEKFIFQNLCIKLGIVEFLVTSFISRRKDFCSHSFNQFSFFLFYVVAPLNRTIKSFKLFAL